MDVSASQRELIISLIWLLLVLIGSVRIWTSNFGKRGKPGRLLALVEGLVALFSAWMWWSNRHAGIAAYLYLASTLLLIIVSVHIWVTAPDKSLRIKRDLSTIPEPLRSRLQTLGTVHVTGWKIALFISLLAGLSCFLYLNFANAHQKIPPPLAYAAWGIWLLSLGLWLGITLHIARHLELTEQSWPLVLSSSALGIARWLAGLGSKQGMLAFLGANDPDLETHVRQARTAQREACYGVGIACVWIALCGALMGVYHARIFVFAPLFIMMFIPIFLARAAEFRGILP
ncbi:MAG: hypothetical protein ACRESE_05090 [Gammaproteobacteria bacterium]